ncbi:MAG: sensor histidine kinase [Burkholderiales bacterium]
MREENALSVYLGSLQTKFRRLHAVAAIAAICRTATHAFKRDTAYFSSRHIYFGLVAATGFPLYYLVWHYIFPQAYESLALRLFGGALFVPIVFARKWPERWANFFPAYWYLTLIFALPFFFTFMLFKNGGSTVWLLSTLIALFMMILLLDWMNLLIHIAVGLSGAIVAFYLTTPLPLVMPSETLQFVPIFLFAIVMGIIVNYSAERVKEERRKAMLSTAGTIAHELRTPLLSIKSGASGLRQYLPTLLEAYRLAALEKLIDSPIRTAHLDSMGGVLERIVTEVDRSNTVVDMLMVNIKGSPRERQAFVPCSITQCVNAALQRYPFVSERERALVHWNPTTDFLFKGSELLTVHVIFNLLKNALRHISRAGKGQIWITLRMAESKNSLVFRDTGTGIRPEILPNIFKRFYSWPNDATGSDATGIGLAFCREVAQAYGGDIDCHSELGEFAEFVIAFPASPS